MSFLLVEGIFFRNTLDLRLTNIEYFHEKTIYVEGNKTPKINSKFTCRFTLLLDLDTVGMMSTIHIDCVTLFTCKHNNALLCSW